MESLRDAIQKVFPKAKVTDVVSKIFGAFEIIINGKLAFSRVQSCYYPEPEKITSLIQDVQDGKTIPVVE